MPHVAAPDGTRIWHTDEGQGLPVLALPGLTRNGGDFDHVATHLAGVRLIRIDSRGRGRSDHADPMTYAVPQEARDVLAVMDALALPRAAVLGTSRGGFVAMAMALMAKDRLQGVCLNDVGPVVEPEGLAVIAGYIGRNPAQRTHEEAAAARAALLAGFRDVPMERWVHEARNHYEARDGRLHVRYDRRMREPVLAGLATPPADPWPFFDALAGLPLALIRGEGSDLLSRATAEEMRRRRPDMVYAEVPGRGHVPFLDEPESLAAIRAWLDLCRAHEAA